MQLRVKPNAWITASGLSPACTLSTARIRISCNVLWSRARASRRFMPSIVSYVYLLMNILIGSRGTAKLLPVKVTAESSPALTAGLDAACDSQSWSAGTIHIQLRSAQVRVEGRVDSGLVREVLECLGR